jgi:hypothetical protein
MTQEQSPQSHISPLRDDTDILLPAAAYLRYELRADGWSAGRQAAFLSHLADTGEVDKAAAIVGKHVSGGYALRRQARGYAFNLGWEAALLIARRIVADTLMAAAIRGEQSVWLREDGKTTFTKQNSKLSLTLLDRVDPAAAFPEVLAIVARFDWYLRLVNTGASARDMWEMFFDAVLPHHEIDARERVRASLLLTEESADFEGEDEAYESQDDDLDEATIEYKSMDGAPVEHSESVSPKAPKDQRISVRGKRISPSQHRVLRSGCDGLAAPPEARPLWVFGALGEQNIATLTRPGQSGAGQSPISRASRSISALSSLTMAASCPCGRASSAIRPLSAPLSRSRAISWSSSLSAATPSARTPSARETIICALTQASLPAAAPLADCAAARAAGRAASKASCAFWPRASNASVCAFSSVGNAPVTRTGGGIISASGYSVS